MEDKGRKRIITFRAEGKDLEAIRALRERWGLISDTAAIRFALRVAYRIANVLNEKGPFAPNPQMEVEK